MLQAYNKQISHLQYNIEQISMLFYTSGFSTVIQDHTASPVKSKFEVTLSDLNIAQFNKNISNLKSTKDNLLNSILFNVNALVNHKIFLLVPSHLSLGETNLIRLYIPLHIIKHATPNFTLGCLVKFLMYNLLYKMEMVQHTSIFFCV